MLLVKKINDVRRVSMRIIPEMNRECREKSTSGLLRYSKRCIVISDVATLG